MIRWYWQNEKLKIIGIELLDIIPNKIIKILIDLNSYDKKDT